MELAKALRKNDTIGGYDAVVRNDDRSTCIPEFTIEITVEFHCLFEIIIPNLNFPPVLIKWDDLFGSQ